jgi:aspartate carbamoyltransferase regulatory subunit
MNKTLLVSAIENGTVIDHINAGLALRIINLLKLQDKQCSVTIGLNLPSRQLKLKDLIKIESYILSHEEANDIAIFAPEATINVIKNFEVMDKITITMPKQIQRVFVCSNAACITQTEQVDTFFYIEAQSKQINLICKYCEKKFDRNQMIVRM